jgi:hypothetical protein
MAAQRWYIAVIVIASRVARSETYTPLLDLQYRLLRAPSHEDAYQRALLLGQEERLSYKNADRQTVTWTFLGLHDLREIDVTELSDGVEVYSQVRRASPEQYVAAKEQLTCFWVEPNKDKTAREILSE